MSYYDAQPVSTAPSSVTEDNFQSLLMGEPGPDIVGEPGPDTLGEPGPDIRLSIDVPSLTSSHSTMTRESVIAQNPRERYSPHGEHPRPASFTSAFGRRRSSLASLSRLINSSYGERSKLSMEVSMETESTKKEKTSKSKRLSRMMQFWKSKEPST
ncbi:hypothetical protein P8C59_004069 [Phyllachora maydis]|uniref:Uncharacterized protein n=1 Tax=Phyllachora maydis TaxID=1825666 RepID=A0AAD9I2N7_9PEZI|nr:hypothetical protein P8C59_004069 [Phyllachora maydis]